jgi:kumamolisin
MFENYQPLSGSERRPGSTATYLRPVGPNETYSVTIVLRRRPDGPPVPSQEYFSTIPPNQRRRLSTDEFAALYGASPDDIAKVAEFVRSHGMQVTETNAARRTVIVSGTAAQMSAAFRVNLGYYSHRVIRRHGEKPQTEDYRGRDGVIQVPTELSQVIIGVFGLDNRRITKHNAADPPNTNPVSVATLRQLYDFPTNSAAGQTIGILSEAGYLPSDINLSFGGNPPQVTDVSVDASNDGTADGETTQDICIAGLAAPGAQIAVFFTTYSQQGWVDLISRVAHPNPGDPVCSVMSSSFYVSNGDDAITLANEGISQSWITAVTAALQDAAIQNVTVCIASGDTGTNSKVGDGKAHVQYPASDPWVLSVGGTTVGNISGTSFDEYVWNDPAPSDPSHWGTTGGGVSDQFPLPQYQADANVPPSLNDGQVRRGVPDVAGNASLNSGYSGLYAGGNPFVGKRNQRIVSALGGIDCST